MGLHRAGFGDAEIAPLKRAFKILYRSGLKLTDALDRVLAECGTAHVRHLVDFVKRSERGIAR